ncbi:hypothetical protein [Polystyrenella longa]|nr:hypothetical protein [Polystyrenella longa]
MALVKGESVNKARRSATTLGGMGIDAAPVLDELKALPDHPDEEVQAAILIAIGKIETAIHAELRSGSGLDTRKSAVQVD